MDSVSMAAPKTKPANARGTNSNASQCSPRDVKPITTQNKSPFPFLNESRVVSVIDENNNVCLLSSPGLPEQDKVKFRWKPGA